MKRKGFPELYTKSYSSEAFINCIFWWNRWNASARFKLADICMYEIFFDVCIILFQVFLMALLLAKKPASHLLNELQNSPPRYFMSHCASAFCECSKKVFSVLFCFTVVLQVQFGRRLFEQGVEEPEQNMRPLNPMLKPKLPSMPLCHCARPHMPSRCPAFPSVALPSWQWPVVKAQLSVCVDNIWSSLQKETDGVNKFRERERGRDRDGEGERAE